MYCRDLQKQALELRIISKIREKWEIYLRNIVHFAAKPPSKSTSKNTRKVSHFADFPQFLHCAFTPCAFTPTTGSANTEEFCEILRKSELFERFLQFFLKGSIAKNKCFRSPVIPCAAQALHFQQLRQFFSISLESIWDIIQSIVSLG